MSNTESNDFDVSDAALDRAAVFGYDQNGHAHKYDPGRAQVIVTRDGEIAHVEQLARQRVPEWIEFVANDKAGWIDCWWSAPGLAVAHKRHQAAKARAADIVYEQAKADTDDAGNQMAGEA